jgi:two-component system, OmpR family, sensor kinase
MSSEAEGGLRAARPGSRRRRTPRFFARLSIRWRLALTSALLTLVILMGFAVIVGALTTRQVGANFDRRVADSASSLQQQIVTTNPYLAPYLREGFRVTCPDQRTLNGLTLTDHAVIRYLTIDGSVICQTTKAPDLGAAVAPSEDIRGYRVENREIPIIQNLSDGRSVSVGQAVLQYARPESEVGQTVARVRAFLIFGVLAGAGLALLAGLAIARRAMRPIAELTARASEIERTRDPSGRVPHPAADDEVAELARTFERMLMSLDAARSDTEAALKRQREFVADASHELRTPLTSVLANLEMLAEELDGERREIASAALRSSQRMRRLVADLLLLARADTGRATPRVRVDLAEVVADAAAEIEPVAGEHEISLELSPAWIDGARDELHRLALNLLGNAVRHTPAGTAVRAAVYNEDGRVVLAVEDDGPGIPAELIPRVFDRFVRGGGEGAGSSGLGLAIVRAVARSHGGEVRIVAPRRGNGARFVVEMPAAPSPATTKRPASALIPSR